MSTKNLTNRQCWKVMVAILFTFHFSLFTSSAQDSLLLRSYDYVKQQDAWLTGMNAAALTRYASQNISEARLSLSHAKGGFTDYYDSPNVLQASGSVESFYRLSPRTVVFGRMAYDNYSGRDMAGSAFNLGPDRHLPFNIVEDSLTNTGRKHRDTYQLTGAVGVDLHRGLSLGARLDYTSANMAKYKDLRHKNALMDMTLTTGIYIPLGPLSLGANYLYRRTTESIRFSTYGTGDKIYKSLIDYGNFIGRVEQFGENGYTDNSREMPLLDDYQGFGVQVGWQIAAGLALYNAFITSWRDGYYGRKSPYTITYTGHDSRVYEYQGRLSYQTRHTLHRLDLAISAENLENRENTFQELTNESGAYYYEYFDAVKTANKLWVNTTLRYTADLGLRHELPTWTLAAGLNLAHRKQTAYDYPYLRRQRLSSTEGSLSADRNLLVRVSPRLSDAKTGVLTLHLGFSLMQGRGEPFDDDTFIAPSDKQEAPPEMAAYLWREYQWLTSAQYAIDGSVRYAFIFPQTRLKTYIQASAAHRKTNEPQPYSAGRDRTTLNISLGCTF